VGDIVEILGVGRDLLKQAPSGLDRRQILFALILSASLGHQPVVASNAFQGAMGQRQVEFADQPASAEGGELLPQGDGLLFDLRRGLAGRVMGSP
jgi:hypothetical protein